MRDKQALYRNTLQRAVQILGGAHVVASPLGLSAFAVESMANGTTDVPEWVFLAAVDVVVTHDLAWQNCERVRQSSPDRPRAADGVGRSDESPSASS